MSAHADYFANGESGFPIRWDMPWQNRTNAKNQLAIASCENNQQLIMNAAPIAIVIAAEIVFGRYAKLSASIMRPSKQIANWKWKRENAVPAGWTSASKVAIKWDSGNGESLTDSLSLLLEYWATLSKHQLS